MNEFQRLDAIGFQQRSYFWFNLAEETRNSGDFDVCAYAQKLACRYAAVARFIMGIV